MLDRRKFTTLTLAAPPLLALPGARAQAAPAGEILRLPTRDGVQVPLFAAWNPHAIATLLLWPGGAGGYGTPDADGWPGSANFLVRTGKLWAARAFNVVMVGRPSDGIDLSDGAVRIGEAHAADNQAVLRAVRQRSPLPLWLVGTSMGTISATATAIRDTDHLAAGLVLTSSITALRIPGAVPRQDLARITVPTLVVHHAHDACRSCIPREAEGMLAAFTHAPVKELAWVTSGAAPSGNPCGPLHYHGYIGAEQETVELIAGWIRRNG